MKKLLFLSAFALLLLNTYTANAQLEGIQIGGGLAFGFEIESVGINAMSVLEFNETWEGAPSFTYFIHSDWSWWELNADAHYVMEAGEGMVWYPFAGLNISGVSIDYPNNPFIDNISDTEFGFNIGAGLEKEFNDTFSGVAEAKYVLSGWDQLVIKVAGLYRIQ